jgi:hypothetical protein
VTVSWQSFDLLAGPSPSRQNQLRTKKEYSSVAPVARSSIRTLASLKRQTVKVDRFRIADTLFTIHGPSEKASLARKV